RFGTGSSGVLARRSAMSSLSLSFKRVPPVDGAARCFEYSRWQAVTRRVGGRWCNQYARRGLPLNWSELRPSIPESKAQEISMVRQGIKAAFFTGAATLFICFAPPAYARFGKASSSSSDGGSSQGGSSSGGSTHAAAPAGHPTTSGGTYIAPGYRTRC